MVIIVIFARMNTYHIPTMDEVWDTIRSLPVGLHTLTGPKNVMADAFKNITDYSRKYMDQTGTETRPVRCAYVGERSAHSTLSVVVGRHIWIDFQPERSLRTRVAMAMERLARKTDPEVRISCAHDQVPQVRNHVSGHVPKISVETVDGGCVVRYRYQDNSALATTVKESLMALSSEKPGQIHIFCKPDEVEYAKRLAMRVAKEKGARVDVKYDGSNLVVSPKNDPLEVACDQFVKKWTERGRHHAEVLGVMGEAVERYRSAFFGLDAIGIPAAQNNPFTDDEEEDQGGMGLVDSVAKFRAQKELVADSIVHQENDDLI